MKRTVLAAAATAAMAALNASAEPAPIGHDPLTNQIMSRQLTVPGGGVTAAVRIGSGQAITLTVADPLAPLKPAEGLAPKPVKAKAKRRARTDREKLGELSESGRRADWSGRK